MRERAKSLPMTDRLCLTEGAQACKAINSLRQWINKFSVKILSSIELFLVKEEY